MLAVEAVAAVGAAQACPQVACTGDVRQAGVVSHGGTFLLDRWANDPRCLVLSSVGDVYRPGSCTNQRTVSLDSFGGCAMVPANGRAAGRVTVLIHGSDHNSFGLSQLRLEGHAACRAGMWRV